MKVAFGSWAFSFGPYSTQPVPLETVAARLSEFGYDGIELCGFPPHITLDRYRAPADRHALRRALNNLNLGVSGYVPDFTLVNPTIRENRQRYLDLFSRALEVCTDLEATLMRVDTVAAPGSILESESADTEARLADLWRAAASRAATAGVRVVWEFEPGFVFNKPSEVVRIHDRVNHPNFRVLFDTCHAFLCGVVGARQQGEHETLLGGVAEFLQLLSGKIGHIHLADTDGTLYGEETTRHCPCGEGLVDFTLLAPALRAIPGIEWWCVDLSFWPGNWELLKPSLDFARRLLAA